jgi:hypothetical protein
MKHKMKQIKPLQKTFKKHKKKEGNSAQLLQLIYLVDLISIILIYIFVQVLMLASIILPSVDHISIIDNRQVDCVDNIFVGHFFYFSSATIGVPASCAKTVKTERCLAK